MGAMFWLRSLATASHSTDGHAASAIHSSRSNPGVAARFDGSAAAPDAPSRAAGIASSARPA